MSSLCLKEDEWVLKMYNEAPDLLQEDINSAPRIWNHLESQVAGKNWQTLHVWAPLFLKKVAFSTFMKYMESGIWLNLSTAVSRYIHVYITVNSIVKTLPPIGHRSNKREFVCIEWLGEDVLFRVQDFGTTLMYPHKDMILKVGNLRLKFFPNLRLYLVQLHLRLKTSSWGQHASPWTGPQCWY